MVLDRRRRLNKASVLCDWRRQLRAWRAWRAVVWAEQKQREVSRTEQELRAENRRELKRNCVILPQMAQYKLQPILKIRL